MELSQKPDIRAELHKWLGLSATSKEARHLALEVTVTASDESSNQ